MLTDWCGQFPAHLDVSLDVLGLLAAGPKCSRAGTHLLEDGVGTWGVWFWVLRDLSASSGLLVVQAEGLESWVWFQHVDRWGHILVWLVMGRGYSGGWSWLAGGWHWFLGWLVVLEEPESGYGLLVVGDMSPVPGCLACSFLGLVPTSWYVVKTLSLVERTPEGNLPALVFLWQKECCKIATSRVHVPRGSAFASCLSERLSKISKWVWPQVLSNSILSPGSQSVWYFVCILLEQSLFSYNPSALPCASPQWPTKSNVLQAHIPSAGPLC